MTQGFQDQYPNPRQDGVRYRPCLLYTSPGVRKVPGGVGGENGAELAGVCPAVDFDGRGLHRNQYSLVRRAEKGFRFIPDGAHGSSGKFVVYQNPVCLLYTSRCV